jgi:hypothetical protein
MGSINTYYSRIINLIIELYHSEFETASAGHCMKITGLSEKELNPLWYMLNEKYPHLATYIISENFTSESEKFLSATKLIELRNQHDKPLLILIPANSRTAAEDSYGNATFKEISLDIIEQKLYEKLLLEIPPQYGSIIKSILNYPYPHDLQRNHFINYLIGILENNISESIIGNSLYHLELLPDEILLKENEKVRTRLNFNINCTEIITNYSRSLFERVSELPIENNTIQKEIVELFRNEEKVNSRKEICQTIFEKFPKLNFTYWAIPDLNFERIELTVDEINSKDFIFEEGKKVLNALNGQVSKVKIRFSTSPNPCDIEELKYFRIVLMEVDGASGTEIMELRKYKNSDSRRQYRDAQIELNPSLIEEGSYFFRVYAEDEHGTILNINDRFKDIKIQRQWEAESNEIRNYYEGADLSQKLKELEIEFNYKKTSDSDDFDFIIEEEPSEPAPIRRDKINCALQAYFQYRIEKLKSREEPDLPVISEDSGIWVNDVASKLLSTYYLKFNNKHVYQSIIPFKLRIIESLLLKHSKSFGYGEITLFSNPSANTLKSTAFKELNTVNQLIPKKILDLREELFEVILKSSGENKGIFETFDFYNNIAVIRKYLDELTQWTTQLRDKFDNLTDLDAEKKAELQGLFLELQNIDIIRLSTQLPDKTPLDVLVLSPLHPLRLTWHLQLFDLFTEWESKTIDFEGHISEWYKNLENLFIGQLYPENNPLVFVSTYNNKAYQYTGELQYGWGIYIKPETNFNIEAISSVNRQVKAYIRNILNISSESYIDSELSQKLVTKHIKNYIIQHPYTNKLIINLFNAGDATAFANALVELEQENKFDNITYEIRLFKGSDSIISHGSSLKNLINPEFTVSEEAEAFSQPSLNKLFPKLRFSVNNIKDYLIKPEDYSAHLSFLVSPFPSKIELIKVRKHYTNFYLNGILMSPSVIVEDSDKETKWNRFVYPNILTNQINEFSNTGITLFANIQSFVAGALVSDATKSFPSTQLHLNEKDNVLISLIHDNSDWVITFDKNLGPQIFDQPSKNGHIPFLLDYIPGEELLGISSFLTTRPTSEILGLLAPHFDEFNIDILSSDNGNALNILLEDLRAISSSIVLQLNLGKNKAFEVIGTAFTKRVLEKKGYLKDSFLIPIDLHQNLFEHTPLASKSRADNLLVSIDTESRVIEITVIEIKCRNSLSEQEKLVLKEKIKDQINNTIHVLKYHFDPENNLSYDRLDRLIKNKELKSLLEFYIQRANRYRYLEDEACSAYLNFLSLIDAGYRLNFKQRGFIFDFSSDIRHQKEKIDNELIFFTFGKKLIDEILDPDSDLNTSRIEKDELNEDLIDCLFRKKDLSDFIKGFDSKESTEYIEKQEIRIDAHEPENNSIKQTDVSIEPDKIENSYEAEINMDNNSRPFYDIIIGKSSESEQFGILGKSIHSKTIAIDLSETNTISLFGVQGGGKSYTIGTVTEMVLKQFQNINYLPSPLASVIFHFSESMDYEPEFISMKYPNDKKGEIDKLINEYKSKPDNINDIVILTPKDKVEERKEEYPDFPVYPIAFNSMELTVQDWLFLLGAIGNDSTYIKQLKSIMKDNRKDLSLINISNGVEETELLSSSQKALARQKLNFAGEYIDDSFNLKEILRPGRLIIVDLRDEFIIKDDALGLFVIMLNIFSSVKSIDDKHFNKFIVFDEAHKYMDNKALTNSIVTSIREMRHKGVSIMIASQDPPSLPNEIIELSSIVIVHKFNSPQWLKHIQKSITQLNPLQASDLSSLNPGEAFLWATKSDDRNITNKPTKIYTRPRVTKHGGDTIKATDNL